MVTLPQVIDASSRLQRPLPDNAIFWPTVTGYGDRPESGDSTKFPLLTAIKTRKGATRAEPLAAFSKAASEAQDSVLVLDDYLFKPEEGAHQERVREVLSWFPANFAARDVRLLTGSIGDRDTEAQIMRQFEELATSINSARAYSDGLRILVKFTLGDEFPYVHDRFAIIDSELWHFGATVGGFHRQVNAATRGWSADDHRAYDFFNLAWRGDHDLGQSHDKRWNRR